jgi:hypothetical protein
VINERLKKRLKKDRPSTTITMRIPADVVESLKAVAPMRGVTACQTLLKSYIARDCAGTTPSSITQRADWLTRSSDAAWRRKCCKKQWQKLGTTHKSLRSGGSHGVVIRSCLCPQGPCSCGSRSIRRCIG